MNTQQTTDPSQAMDGKTIAIISYLTIIGWVIAYVQYGNNKSQLAAFHIRQSLFLMLCAFGICIISMFFAFIPYIGWIISFALNLSMLGFLVLWIMGLINAINGEEKPLPVLGNKAQDFLKGIK